MDNIIPIILKIPAYQDRLRSQFFVETHPLGLWPIHPPEYSPIIKHGFSITRKKSKNQKRSAKNKVGLSDYNWPFLVNLNKQTSQKNALLVKGQGNFFLCAYDRISRMLSKMGEWTVSR